MKRMARRITARITAAASAANADSANASLYAEQPVAKWAADTAAIAEARELGAAVHARGAVVTEALASTFNLVLTANHHADTLLHLPNPANAALAAVETIRRACSTELHTFASSGARGDLHRLLLRVFSFYEQSTKLSNAATLLAAALLAKDNGAERALAEACRISDLASIMQHTARLLISALPVNFTTDANASVTLERIHESLQSRERTPKIGDHPHPYVVADPQGGCGWE